MIVAEINALLSGIGSPVLTPEQIEVPSQFQAGGDHWSMPVGGLGDQPQSGLLGYLSANPSGFVQITEPREFSVGPTGEWRTVITVVAPDRTSCQTLADEVQRRLAGTWANPGLYQIALPGLARSSGAGSYVCAQTFASVVIRNQ